MGTCTVYKLKGADFSGQGLPNIFPFVSRDALDYGFDLTSGNLSDLTNRTKNLVPYRTISVSGNAGSHIVDDSVMSAVDHGVLVTGGCLVTSKAFERTPIQKGEISFSRLFVGGWSGGTIPTVGATPQIATLLDMGNSISPDGGPMFSVTTSSNSVGVRVGTGGTQANVGSVVSNIKKFFFLLLTYDGETWTLHNKTTNEVIKKTNADLGRTTPYIDGSINTPKFHHIGHGHKGSTLAGLPVIASQFASWNKVLSDQEIEQQYMFSKDILGDLI